eukprot:scaffold146_cov265-Pinguiococcus_pyrenoidosus.AAC.36
MKSTKERRSSDEMVSTSGNALPGTRPRRKVAKLGWGARTCSVRREARAGASSGGMEDKEDL